MGQGALWPAVLVAEASACWNLSVDRRCSNPVLAQWAVHGRGGSGSVLQPPDFSQISLGDDSVSRSQRACAVGKGGRCGWAAVLRPCRAWRTELTGDPRTVGEARGKQRPAGLSPVPIAAWPTSPSPGQEPQLHLLALHLAPVFRSISLGRGPVPSRMVLAFS